VTPTFNRLKSLRLINHHIRALRAATTNEHGRDEEGGFFHIANHGLE
jgi:hypothetical protein